MDRPVHTLSCMLVRHYTASRGSSGQADSRHHSCGPANLDRAERLARTVIDPFAKTSALAKVMTALIGTP